MICSILCASLVLRVQPEGLQLKTASKHPMRYYLSLPTNWSKDRTWPVVVAIESADRDFRGNAEAFIRARGRRPFIVLVPEVVTNGGPLSKEAPGYSYSLADWSRVDRDGGWKFDEDGLAAVIADVRDQFSGNPKYYLTGWEAGTHTVFALAFAHPERLAAVAPVCPNYAGRYVSFSNGSGRQELPIRVFAGSADPSWGPDKPLTVQTTRAEKEAKQHGFHFSFALVPGKGHGPLAEAVLGWFDTLLGQK